MDSSDEIKTFETGLVRMDDDAKKVVSNMSIMEDKLFIAKSKLDHLLFKANIYTGVRTSNDQMRVTGHTECAFGKWYYSDAREKFGQTMAYQNMELPHKAIHDHAKGVVAALGDVDYSVEEKFQKIYDGFGDMENSALELFGMLDKMLEEKYHTV